MSERNRDRGRKRKDRGEKNREGEGRKRDRHKRLKNHRMRSLCLSVTPYRYTNRNPNVRLAALVLGDESTCTSSSFRKSANMKRTDSHLLITDGRSKVGELLYPISATSSIDGESEVKTWRVSYIGKWPPNHSR